MKTSSLIFAALLCFAATAAVAATAPAAPASGKAAADKGGGHSYCAEHAKECQDLAASFDKWCSANNEKCMAMKANIEHRRERCEKDKAACQEERQNMREKMEEMCKQHPDKPRCVAMKDKNGDVENEDDQDAGGAH